MVCWCTPQVFLIQEYLGIVMEYAPGGTLAEYMVPRRGTGPDGGLPEKTARCAFIERVRLGCRPGKHLRLLNVRSFAGGTFRPESRSNWAPKWTRAGSTQYSLLRPWN